MPDFAAYLPQRRSPLDVSNALMNQDLVASHLQQNALAVRQAQEIDAQRQGLRQAIQSGQLNPEDPAHQNQLLAQFPDVAPALLKGVQDRQQVASKTKLETAQAGEHDIKAQAGKVALMGQKLSAIDPNDDNAIANWYRDGVKSGLIDADSAMAEIQKVPPAGPDRLKWYAAQQTKGLALKDQFDNQIKAQEEAGRNNRNAADIQGRAATNAATNARVAAEGAANRGQAERHFQTRQAAEAAAPKGQIVQTDQGPMLVDPRAGTSQAIKGPNGEALGPKTKDIPQQVVKGYTENQTALQKIDDAIAAIKANPSAMGLANYMGDTVRQRTDTKGVPVRAQVADIGSLKMHDRSGAAVTASETPRLKPFIPDVRDSAEAAIAKLEQMKVQYQDQNAGFEGYYNADLGYKPITAVGRPPRTQAPAGPVAQGVPPEIAAILQKHGKK
jgi:hypothetical protein